MTQHDPTDDAATPRVAKQPPPPVPKKPATRRSGEAAGRDVEDRDVEDRAAEHRFVLADDAGDAQLVYRAERDRLVLVHTEVPDALSGRGIGSRLVRAAVDRARRTGETVVPSCPFAAQWLREHDDVAATISIDWPDRPSR